MWRVWNVLGPGLMFSVRHSALWNESHATGRHVWLGVVLWQSCELRREPRTVLPPNSEFQVGPHQNWQLRPLKVIHKPQKNFLVSRQIQIDFLLGLKRFPHFLRM